MLIVTNPRHERFAQLLAEGHTADEAYNRAGYTPNRGNAIRLKANERIARRVAEIQAAAAEGDQDSDSRAAEFRRDLLEAFEDDGPMTADQDEVG